MRPDRGPPPRRRGYTTRKTARRYRRQPERLLLRRVLSSASKMLAGPMRHQRGDARAQARCHLARSKKAAAARDLFIASYRLVVDRPIARSANPYPAQCPAIRRQDAYQAVTARVADEERRPNANERPAVAIEPAWVKRTTVPIERAWVKPAMKARPAPMHKTRPGNKTRPGAKPRSAADETWR